MIGLSFLLLVQPPAAVAAKAREDGAPAVILVAAGLPDKRKTDTPAAAKRPRPAPVTTTIVADRTGYSAGKGYRRVAGAEVSREAGPTSLTLGFMQGERNQGPTKASYTGVQVGAVVSHDWNARLATATSLSVASDNPVFGRLQAAQDVLLRLGARTRVQVGGRYTRFHDGAEMVSGVAGLSRSFGAAQLSYRVSGFALPRGGGISSAHLVAVELGDRRGKGKSAFSVAAGDSLHELEWHSASLEGRYRSAGIKRSQPLTKTLSLSFSAGRTWYERPQASYRGTKFGFSIAFWR